MKSVCSNCGGELLHGNALGACARCGHALTGALWTLEPPSRRVIANRNGGSRSRLALQVLAGVLAGCVASVILFGLIRAEQEAAESSANLSTTQHALRPAPSTGLSPAKNAPTTPRPLASAPLLHANAPARPLGAIANENPTNENGANEDGGNH